ncbi:putative ZDHHC-type palmitoyltransferase 4 [Mya arenaria]|uniref:putative ZDHHC-type palmitoyltransferase 4 n=1 Tax=Mya arenaria TaxID=6604 RepID=UPI0022E53CE9|nr:putative ZDHHC-type palmitoyltransferase 4 [Mya arenaria]
MPGPLRRVWGHVRVSWPWRKFMSIVNSLWFINWLGQSLFLFGILSIAVFGIQTTLPYFNPDEYDCWVRTVFGYFLVTEIMVNWLCLKYVGSGYSPFKHGAMPDNVKIGQKVCASVPSIQNGLDYPYNGDNNKARKDATAVNMMYVATQLPNGNNNAPERTAFPYFSWTPCLRCNRPRPPRCHHCPLCDNCVLKRDHHCFIVGVCVGYRNQRHFIVFLFWCALGTMYALVNEIPYMYYVVLPHISYLDIFFPFAIIRAFFGYISWYHTLLIVVCSMDIGFVIWASGFLQVHMSLILRGKTTFEDDFKITVTDTRNRSQKIASVFGQYWLLNFLVPMHFVFEPQEDPVKWYYIRS